MQHLGPATDFYKKLALDCSGQQISVDLFLLSSQYADLASLGKNTASAGPRWEQPANLPTFSISVTVFHPLNPRHFSSSSACISKYSAGSIFYYPSFHYIHNPAQLEKFQKDLERYLTRKIGFEAVMRIRCTKGTSRCRRVAGGGWVSTNSCGACRVLNVRFLSRSPQVCPFIRSTGTSLCDPLTCCPWLM